MAKSIKKKTAHNIYFGEDIDTGEFRHISAVPSGARCRCICASCKKPLEARKGDIRRHHFAHESNYECVYANEVAIYDGVKKILEDKRMLATPQITLSFRSWNNAEVLKPSQVLSLEEVKYDCEPLQYPPVLMVCSSGKTLRILIEFGDYYSKDDIDSLKAEARQEGYSALLFQFPDIDNADNAEFFSVSNLTDCVIRGKASSFWLRSALEDRVRSKFLAYAQPPKRNPVGYDCPIHIAKYGETFFARDTDCAQCRFNLGERQQCLCIGATGIQSHKDFELSSEELRMRCEAIRAENEKKIEEAEKKAAEEVNRRASIGQDRNPHFQGRVGAEQVQYDAPHEADLDVEEKRIIANFNPAAEEPIIDCFGERWVLCEKCGKVKRARDMISYGGRHRDNLGVCRECNRKADST